MDLKCTKHDANGTHLPGRENGEVVAGCFYWFELTEGENPVRTGNRTKVAWEGELDYEAIVNEFKDKGVTLTADDLKTAHEA